MNMIKLAAIAACGVAGTAHATVLPFSVSYESENPGAQNTTTTFSAVGVETFETRNFGDNQTFTTDFGGSQVFSGVYANVDIIGADQYGGADGAGKYPVKFSGNSYSLELTTTLPRGVNYFGYWLSALDGRNLVHFYSGNKLLFTFSPQDVINAVNATNNPSAYYGNPNGPFLGQNSGEPYIFLNFYSDLRPFTKVVFEQAPGGGGYESDNHTVGRYLRKSGTFFETPGSTTPTGDVPEPASWALLITGFGLVGTVARRRRIAIAA